MTTLKFSWDNDYPDAWQPPPRDIDKWIRLTEQVNSLAERGMDRQDALEQVSGTLSSDERLAYKRWLKFYTGGNHLKYTRAQYVGGNGYFLPMDAFKSKSSKPLVDDQDEQLVIDQVDIFKQKEDEKRSAEEQAAKKVDSQRKKILSRLDALERLVRSDEGSEILGDEADTFINSIFDLKTRFSKLRTKKSEYLLEDFLIREANILGSYGFTKSAQLIKDAFEVGEHVAFEPVAIEPNAGSPYGSIMAGNLIGDMVAAKNPHVVDFTPIDKLIKEMEEAEAYDGLVDIDENDADSELVSFAQDMSAEPAPEAKPAASATPTPAKPAVTKEDLITNPNLAGPESKGKDIDAMLDSVFKDITVQDVVNKLDSISAVLKVGEISRQLSLVDMMLQALGMGSIFRELAEAQNKALEFNNYTSTRIDNMLYQLKGSLGGGADPMSLDVDHTVSTDPTAEAVKSKLTQEKEDDRKKKELRKKQESEALEVDLPEGEGGAAPESGTLAGEGEKPAQATPATPAAPVQPAKPVQPPAKV
jgi:hypothetical protein